MMMWGMESKNKMLMFRGGLIWWGWMWEAFSSPSPASDPYNTCTHTSIPLTPSCPLPPETSASSSFFNSLECFRCPAPVAKRVRLYELYLAKNGLILFRYIRHVCVKWKNIIRIRGSRRLVASIFRHTTSCSIKRSRYAIKTSRQQTIHFTNFVLAYWRRCIPSLTLTFTLWLPVLMFPDLSILQLSMAGCAATVSRMHSKIGQTARSHGRTALLHTGHTWACAPENSFEYELNLTRNV